MPPLANFRESNLTRDHAMSSTHVNTIESSNLCTSGDPTSNSQGEPPRTPSSALRRARKSLPYCLHKQSATATQHVAFAPEANITASTHGDANRGPNGTSAWRVSGILVGNILGDNSTWDSLTPCRKRPQLPNFLDPTASQFVPAHLQDAVTAQK